MIDTDKGNEDAKDIKEEAKASSTPKKKSVELKKPMVKKQASSAASGEQEAAAQSASESKREVLTKKLQDFGVMSGKTEPKTPVSESKKLSRFALAGVVFAAAMFGLIAYMEITKNPGNAAVQIAQAPQMQYMPMPPGPYVNPWSRPDVQNPALASGSENSDEQRQNQQMQQQAVDPWGRPYPPRPPMPSRTMPGPQGNDGRYGNQYGGAMPPDYQRWPQPFPRWAPPPQWRMPEPAGRMTPPTNPEDQPKSQADNSSNTAQQQRGEWPPAFPPPPQYRPFPRPGYYGAYGYQPAVPYYGYQQ